MQTSPWTRRWRQFADAVAILLGVNVWVSVVLLPGLFVNAWRSGGAMAAAAAPLLVLAAGLWRRSELLLLFAYPSAILLPAVLAPGVAAGHVYGPIQFGLVAAGLVAYLLGASLLTSYREPPPPAQERPLSSAAQPVAPRWRRRMRVYTMLAVLSVVFPVVLVYATNFDGSVRAFLRGLYPGRAAGVTALLTLGVLLFWLFVYSWVFLGALRPHRTGDRDLVQSLAQVRGEVARGRPRPQFYLGVAAALASMLVLLVLRYG